MTNIARHRREDEEKIMCVFFLRQFYFLGWPVGAPAYSL
jgi:hypothetical protein